MKIKNAPSAGQGQEGSECDLMLNNSITREDDIFQRANDPAPLDVLQAFLPGVKIRHNKTSSPFTEDRNPSFHIYPSGFKDYSTGEYYDNVAFVAKLLKLRPLEAAKLICENLGIPYQEGPLSRQDKLKLAQAKAQRLRERRLQEAFEYWVRMAGRQVRAMAEAILIQFGQKGLDADDNLVALVHELPLLEYWADILTEGSEAEIIEIYRDRDFRGWFPCKS